MFGRRRTVVGAAALVAELARDAHPRRTVTRADARNGVGDLVEKYLVDFIIPSAAAQVPRHGNTFVLVITLTEACLCVIELKTPGRIQVESNEGISPNRDPL